MPRASLTPFHGALCRPSSASPTILSQRGPRRKPCPGIWLVHYPWTVSGAEQPGPGHGGVAKPPAPFLSRRSESMKNHIPERDTK